jgi:hypothetical protein
MTLGFHRHIRFSRILVLSHCTSHSLEAEPWTSAGTGRFMCCIIAESACIGNKVSSEQIETLLSIAHLEQPAPGYKDLGTGLLAS